MYVSHFIFIIYYIKIHKVQLVLWSCAWMWSIQGIVGNLAVRPCSFIQLSIANIFSIRDWVSQSFSCLMHVYNDSFCEFMSASAMPCADCTVTFSTFPVLPALMLVETSLDAAFLYNLYLSEETSLCTVSLCRNIANILPGSLPI